MFDYAARQARLNERLEEEGIDALFLAPSADLEYLTGVERQIPNFGEASYAHGWVTGALFRPGNDPVFLFPRMFAAFDLREDPQGEVIVVNETDDGPRSSSASPGRSAATASSPSATGSGRRRPFSSAELSASTASARARGSSTSCAV